MVITMVIVSMGLMLLASVVVCLASGVGCMPMASSYANEDECEYEREAENVYWIHVSHFGLGLKTFLLSAFHTSALRNLRALPMTDTELKLIAAAASIGLSSNPKKG